MTSTSKRHKPHITAVVETVHDNDSYDLVADHCLIAPFEICAVGLLSVLMKKHIIDCSFSKMYQHRIGWEKIFVHERQKLKPNDISVLKCFVLNRLLHQYLKNPDAFIQETKTIYNEIQSRMTREFLQWTSQDLYKEVQRWQSIQCRRRLFHFHHREVAQLPGLLMLHKASTNWCHCLIKYYQQNKKSWESEGRHRFIEQFENSFIIVAQPTDSDGAAVTQYTKSTFGHSARLITRIICLLDPDVLKDFIELSNIGVTLYPLNRNDNDKQEQQPTVIWQIKKVMSAEGVPVSLCCGEINILELKKFDSVYKRLSLNSTLCQLEFQITIKIKDPTFEQTIRFTSQPFGICSHRQYYPKYVAQIFVYEMKEALNNKIGTTDPDIITEFVRRYYVRMTGVEPMEHTNRYIRDLFAKAIADLQSTGTMQHLDSIYETILAKIISQIDFIVLYPVLSLMYDDGLFLGICDETELDQTLYGTPSQPQLLLRLNSLTYHQWNGSGIVQFVVHNGHLKRASFDMKTFANELCRFICESMDGKTKQALVLSHTLSRQFTDFRWYFHEDLYRLNKIEPPNPDAYDPLLPVLWMTMREDETVKDDCTSHRRKRKRSNSFLPVIESVSSEPLPIPVNVVVRLDNSPSHSSTSPLPTVEDSCQPHDDQKRTTKARQFLVEVPQDVNVSPAVIFRYLADKFANTSPDPNEDPSTKYFFLPSRTDTSLVDLIASNHRKGVQSTCNYSTSSSESSKLESHAFAEDRQHSLKIKEETNDVDYVIFNGAL